MKSCTDVFDRFSIVVEQLHIPVVDSAFVAFSKTRIHDVTQPFTCQLQSKWLQSLNSGTGFMSLRLNSSGNKKCQPFYLGHCINMLSYPMLSINIKLCIAVTFSGILTNFPKQKLATIALNNLNKNLIALTTAANFFKRILMSQVERVFPV